MFKVNNKNRRTTSATYFIPLSRVSIVNIEQLIHCLPRKKGEKNGKM